jgi:hypothetical protein
MAMRASATGFNDRSGIMLYVSHARVGATRFAVR